MQYAYMHLYEYYKVDIMLPSAQLNFSADTVGRNHEGKYPGGEYRLRRLQIEVRTSMDQLGKRFRVKGGGGALRRLRTPATAGFWTDI